MQAQLFVGLATVAQTVKLPRPAASFYFLDKFLSPSYFSRAHDFNIHSNHWWLVFAAVVRRPDPNAEQILF